jgi:hypothetical protein
MDGSSGGIETMRTGSDWDAELSQLPDLLARREGQNARLVELVS